MINIENLEIYLEDIYSVNFTLFGIALTIFTVLYSFILNKKDDLKLIADRIKFREINPMLKPQESYAIRYIKKLKRVNNHIIFISCLTFSIVIYSWAVNRFVEEIILKNYLFYPVAIVSLFVMVYFSIILIFIYMDYRQTINIQ